MTDEMRGHLQELASELTGAGWRDTAPQHWTEAQRAAYDRWALEMMGTKQGRQTLTDWWQTVRAGQMRGSTLPVYTLDPTTGALTGCVIREYVGVDVEEV